MFCSDSATTELWGAISLISYDSMREDPIRVNPIEGVAIFSRSDVTLLAHA